MRKDIAAKIAILAIWATTFAPRAYSWGAVGHSAINYSAIDLMQSRLKDLFNQHRSSIASLANVPDTSWKTPDQGGQLEKKAHFFQWDRYSDTLSNHMPIHIDKAIDLTGCDYVYENGTAVWRVHQLHDLLVQALRKKDWTVAIQMAGTMGHYVADLSQPLHVTSDYDGQSINRPGIHSHFENKIISSVGANELQTQILKRAPKPFDGEQNMSVVRIAFEEGKTALERLPSVLEIFATEDRNDDEAAREIAFDALAEGALTLAMVWDHAAKEANFGGGMEDGQGGDIGQPKWVPYSLNGSQDGSSRNCVR